MLAVETGLAMLAVAVVTVGSVSGGEVTVIAPTVMMLAALEVPLVMAKKYLWLLFLLLYNP